MDTRRTSQPARVLVAPRWLQMVAKICFALGLIALVRSPFESDPTFLWAGLTMIAVGLLGPGLSVALGGGVESDDDEGGGR